MPFRHLHVNEDDHIKPCCLASPIAMPDGSFKKFSKDFDYINDTEYNLIRSKMLAGEQIKECRYCYDIESKGGESFRLRNNSEWNNVTTPNLVYYDVRNDNTCNLMCRMCYPGASNQLAKEYKEIGWALDEYSTQYKLIDIVDITKVERLFVAGGEPTLMPEFIEFLEKAIEYNRTDIALRIITNATNINKKISELLLQFKNIEFTVSIDGYDQTNRYIRWPSNWESIIENIHKLFKITKNISFNVTVSMWNVTNLSKLIFFLEDTFPQPVTVFLNEAMSISSNGSVIVDPSPFNYPNKEQAITDLSKIKKSVSYHKENNFKNKLDYFITNIEKHKLDINSLRTFFKYNDTLDKSRNIKLIDYIPELEECRNYLTKQI